NNPSIPTGSLSTPPSTQAIQTTGSPPASSAPPSPNQTSQHSGTPPTTNASTSKLPKLTLPKFRGEVTQFKPFWDTFESAVHSNPNLSKIAKFNYLVAQLEGAASRAIAGLPITEDNYQAAVDILMKRFGKPQQIIASHMDELLKISVCSSERPSQLLCADLCLLFWETFLSFVRNGHRIKRSQNHPCSGQKMFHVPSKGTSTGSMPENLQKMRQETPSIDLSTKRELLQQQQQQQRAEYRTSPQFRPIYTRKT
ncbi:hypothetical protein pdam_00012153, partial [Pocillopora damicornis]